MDLSSDEHNLHVYLRNEDATQRENVLIELSNACSPLTWIACRVLINDSDELVRVRATEILEEYAGTDDEYLVQLVLKSDPSDLVRASAASTLAKIGGEKAKLELVSQLFSERDPMVKRYIASALADYRDSKLIPLLKYLLSEEQDPNIRTGLLYGLYRSGDASAISELLRLLDHDDYMIRSQVINSLQGGIDAGDSMKIVMRLQDRISQENHPAVVSSITKLISSLTDS